MNISRTAVENIEGDVIFSLGGTITVANGNPIKTGEFVTKIAHAIAEIDRAIGPDFTVDLHFGSYGVIVKGITK